MRKGVIWIFAFAFLLLSLGIVFGFTDGGYSYCRSGCGDDCRASLDGECSVEGQKACAYGASGILQCDEGIWKRITNCGNYGSCVEIHSCGNFECMQDCAKYEGFCEYNFAYTYIRDENGIVVDKIMKYSCPHPLCDIETKAKEVWDNNPAATQVNGFCQYVNSWDKGLCIQCNSGFAERLYKTPEDPYDVKRCCGLQDTNVGTDGCCMKGLEKNAENVCYITGNPVNGECGYANGRTYPILDEESDKELLCSQGSVASGSFHTTSDGWAWTCAGISGGNSVSCSATRTPIIGYCGDSHVDAPPETCDDGNTASGDGCSSTCQLENKICGDGAVQTPNDAFFNEQCEGTNIFLSGKENCDNHDEYTSGTLGCKEDCTYDYSQCIKQGGPTCQDGAANQESEDCDKVDFRGKTCKSLGYASGNLKCTTGCKFDKSGCVPESGRTYCGDLVIQNTGNSVSFEEQCEGTNIFLSGKENCDNHDEYTSGTLGCKEDCTYDYSQCIKQGGPTCQDGAANQESEDCDKVDFRGKTCKSLGYASGNLKCTTGCKFDKSGCKGIIPIVEKDKPSSMYWTNTNNVKINSIVKGNKVKAVIEGVKEGLSIKYQIRKNTESTVKSGAISSKSGDEVIEWETGTTGIYYFKISIDGETWYSTKDGENMESDYGELEVKPEIPNECLVNLILSCGDYSESDCSDDKCLVAGDTKISYLEETKCYIERTYSCKWDTACKKSETIKVIDSGCPSVASGGEGYPDKIGTCLYEDETTGVCSGGFIDISWTAEWNWDAGNTEHVDPLGYSEECKDGTKTMLCPSTISLSFFTFKNVILAVALIVLIYLVIHLRKCKKNSRKKRK